MLKPSSSQFWEFVWIGIWNWKYLEGVNSVNCSHQTLLASQFLFQLVEHFTTSSYFEFLLGWRRFILISSLLFNLMVTRWLEMLYFVYLNMMLICLGVLIEICMFPHLGCELRVFSLLCCWIFIGWMFCWFDYIFLMWDTWGPMGFLRILIHWVWDFGDFYVWVDFMLDFVTIW